MIEISCKINLKGYESIGITVTGDDRDTIINEIRDIGDHLAPDDEETKKMITRYINRVFGTQTPEEPAARAADPVPDPAPAKTPEPKQGAFETADKYTKVCESCGAPLVKIDVDICKQFLSGQLLCRTCRDNLTRKGGK